MTGQQVMARLRERDGDGELLSLVKRVAAAHHVTVEELLGVGRHAESSHARQALWAALHERGHWSYSRLGKVFGRDHTTVMAGINAHRMRMGLGKRVQKQGATFCPPCEQELP